MFPPVRTRTRAALLRVVDRAIEFATLGEYGLEVPGADGVHASGTGRSAHSVARRPGAVASPEQLPRRVKAATPAGRRAGDRPSGGPPRTGDRSDALSARVPAPLFRQRGGAVPPPPHPCLALSRRG
jgi:hypothetical protein